MTKEPTPLSDDAVALREKITDAVLSACREYADAANAFAGKRLAVHTGYILTDATNRVLQAIEGEGRVMTEIQKTARKVRSSLPTAAVPDYAIVASYDEILISDARAICDFVDRLCPNIEAARGWIDAADSGTKCVDPWEAAKWLRAIVKASD